MVKRVYNHFMGDSLYRNSIYLMASTLVLAVFGFLFWIINARLFKPDQIGLATTIISIATLLSTFSLLGLNAGIIRYLPGSDQKNHTLNTSFTLIIITTLIFSIGYLAGIQLFSSKLIFIRENPLYAGLFVLMMIFIALNTIMDSIFTAYRSTKYVLVKNVLLSLVKLALPFLLVAFGAYGIFMSFGMSMIAACIFAFVMLITKFQFSFRPTIHTDVVKKMIKFSSGNYITGLITALPMGILPVLITNKLGASTSAYFYMGMMIANLLYIIPMATAQSLFAEGSHVEENLYTSLKKAIVIIVALLIPAIIITALFGNYILRVFGEQYATEGFTFLKLIAVSGIFVALNQIGMIIFNIKHKVHFNVLFNVINTVLILVLSYLFISQQLVGIGFAWLLGQAITALLYLVFLYKFSK
jgi:O-antigen/teichoic acid export membrane protein